MSKRIKNILLLAAICLGLIVCLNEYLLYYFNPQEFNNWVNDSLFYFISIVLWSLLFPLIYQFVLWLKTSATPFIISLLVFSFVISLAQQILANIIFYSLLFLRELAAIENIYNQFRDMVIGGLFSRLTEALGITLLFYFIALYATQIKHFIAHHLVKLYHLLYDESEFISVIKLKEKNDELTLIVNEIECFESAGNYVCILINHKSYLFRQTMSRLYTQLNDQHFLRIHRSYIINIQFINKIAYTGNGEYRIEMKSGKTMQSSRHYKHDIAMQIRMIQT